jgi:type I site-specific restriction-modification system R (restriction) subunit
MLESLITSKTRIKLLLKFFLNSNTSAHLRGLESEFHESTNGIRLELNRFEQAGLLHSYTEGNKKLYKANPLHPLFTDIQHLVQKHLGIDQFIEQVIDRLGEIQKVYLTGAFARGQESPYIEMIMVSRAIDQSYLDKLIDKASRIIHREIRYTLIEEDLKTGIQHPGSDNLLLIWEKTV